MKKLQKHIDFAKIWNDFDNYKTAQEVADAFGCSLDSAKSRARHYRELMRRKPELGLEDILDRSRVHKEGLTYKTHDIVIKHSVSVDKSKTRYVITSAQFGADVNEELLDTLKFYCKETNAQLLVLPIRYGLTLDPMSPLLNDFVTYKGHTLHKHVELNYMSLRPTLMNPLSGLHRYASKRSQIFAHPQQALEFSPRSNIKVPKAIMTTGSVTHPLYGFDKTSEQAEFEHKFGAVVVELDGGQFHFRHIASDVNGEFCDIAGGESYLYGADSKKKIDIDALVCGDWHTGETCPVVRKATYNGIIPALKPSSIIKHDFLDGRSISHHDERDHVRMAQKAMSGQNNLKGELDYCSKELDFIRDNSNGAKVIMVASNHNDHLDQYLSESRYVKDWINMAEATGLVTDKIMTRKPAFEIAMLKRGQDDVRFLKRDEDFKINDWKLDLHGDVGCNGARGSAVSFDRVGLKAIVGHSHTPSIKRNVLTVGTSTPLKVHYTKGLTSWLNTHAIVYPNGQAQLINIIGGKWHG